MAKKAKEQSSGRSNVLVDLAKKMQKIEKANGNSRKSRTDEWRAICDTVNKPQGPAKQP